MKRRGAPKADDGIGYDEWRECALPGCGSRFRPPAGLVDPQPTVYYCSTDCAAAALRARYVRPPLVLAPEVD